MTTKSVCKWIPVKKELPVIPEGKYAIQVLVAVFDHVFEEISPGRGYHVSQASYGRTKARNGEPVGSLFDYADVPECDFMTLYIGKRTEFGPIMDEVTHWMYLPEPPMYPTRKK